MVDGAALGVFDFKVSITFVCDVVVEPFRVMKTKPHQDHQSTELELFERWRNEHFDGPRECLVLKCHIGRAEMTNILPI